MTCFLYLVRCLGAPAALSLVLALLALMPRAGQAQQPLRYDNWVLEWAEEFEKPGDSTLLQNRWLFAYPWGRSSGTFEGQYYIGEHVRVDSASNLRLTAERVSTARSQGGRTLEFESGMLFQRLETINKPGEPELAYGLYEIRCRQPRDNNSFPAFWLYWNPDEVDIFECNPLTLSNNIILSPHSYWRRTWQEAKACQCFFEVSPKGAPLSRDMHTYGLAWTPTELVFYYDGVPIRRDNRLLPLGYRMPQIVNLAVWKWAALQQDALTVEYIRLYRPKQPVDPTLNRTAYLHQGYPALQENYPALTYGQQSRQTWLCSLDPTTGLRLALIDNYNPVCSSSGQLPARPAPAAWAPPLLLTGETDIVLRHELPAQTCAYRLYNWLGQPVRSGLVRSGEGTRLRWPELKPGQYTLELTHTGTRLRHPVHVLAPL